MAYLRWVYRCLTLKNRLCMHPWMEVKQTPSYFANLAWLSSLQIHESRRIFFTSRAAARSKVGFVLPGEEGDVCQKR